MTILIILAVLLVQLVVYLYMHRDRMESLRGARGAVRAERGFEPPGQPPWRPGSKCPLGCRDSANAAPVDLIDDCDCGDAQPLPIWRK